MATRNSYRPQQPLFNTVESSWRPPRLDELPSWADCPRIGIDLETRDPQLKALGPGAGRRKDSYIVGCSFALEDGPKHYLPFRHAGGDNLPEDGVLRYLRDNITGYKGIVVGANLSYELDYLAGEGLEFKNAKMFRDVQIAEPLLDELQLSYSLNNILLRHGMDPKDEEILRAAANDWGIDPKSDMWQLPARFVGVYAEGDADKPLKLLRQQERQLEEQNLWGVYDLESKLLPILTRIRRKGVRIDLKKLEQIELWAHRQERDALERVHLATGHRICVGDVWKGASLVPALTKIGIKLAKTPTGQDKVDKDLLGSIDHPVAKDLNRARKVNKLRTTFAASIRDHIVGDRIHCTFNQLRRQKEGDEGGDDGGDESGARYGRMSSEHPNLQQQPSRDEFAAPWRSIYLPEEGKLWASCDYSQQEPRMAVHYATLSRELIGYPAWLKAIHARDCYRNDPNTDNHQMMANMVCGGIANSKQRKEAKEIYLGLSYGMGGAKMCRKLGLPTRMVVYGRGGVVVPADSDAGRELMAQGARRMEAAGVEGQALLDKFDAEVPFIKRLAKACEARAKKVGYVVTISGRRCRFPVDEHGNYDWTFKALNRLIQGGSACQTKIAMVALDEAGVDVIIQVHDEIAANVKNAEEAEAAADIMRTCVKLELPSKVDVELGRSWGESMINKSDVEAVRKFEEFLI